MSLFFLSFLIFCFYSNQWLIAGFSHPASFIKRFIPNWTLKSAISGSWFFYNVDEHSISVPPFSFDCLSSFPTRLNNALVPRTQVAADSSLQPSPLQMAIKIECFVIEVEELFRMTNVLSIVIFAKETAKWESHPHHRTR